LHASLPAEQMRVKPLAGWALRSMSKPPKRTLPAWAKEKLTEMFNAGATQERRKYKAGEAWAELRRSPAAGSLILFDATVTEQRVAQFFSSMAAARKRQAQTSAAAATTATTTTTTTTTSSRVAPKQLRYDDR
jgi:hypothetical protein